MRAIVADPVGEQIYFAYVDVEMINTNGSGRTTFIAKPGSDTTGLAVDIQKR